MLKKNTRRNGKAVHFFTNIKLTVLLRGVFFFVHLCLSFILNAWQPVMANSCSHQRLPRNVPHISCRKMEERRASVDCPLLTLAFVCSFHPSLHYMCAFVIVVPSPCSAHYSTISLWTVSSESNTEIKIQDTQHDTSLRFNTTTISSALAC